MRRILLSAVMFGVLATGCDFLTPGGGGGTGGGGGSGGSGGGSGGGTGDGGVTDGGFTDGGTTDGGFRDGGTGDGGVGGGTIAEVAAANPELSTLRAALEKAGMTAALSDATGSLTVFAPTNAAFEQLLTELGVTNGLEGLSAAQLAPILRYHVLNTRVPTAAAIAAGLANTGIDSQGGRIQVSLQGPTTIRLDDRATVTTAGVDASNGIIHVIDRVLLPSLRDIGATAPEMTNFFAAVARADADAPNGEGLESQLDDDAGPRVTVLVPSNDAFNLLIGALRGADEGKTTGITSVDSFRPDQLSPILRYHVLTTQALSSAIPAAGPVETLGGRINAMQGGTVMLDGANIVTADLYASNGVIHVISQVLLPSIADVISTDPRFSGLYAAVLASDAAPGTTPKLAEALDGMNPYTLFAPSNEAFTALGAGAPTGQALTNVLLYHAAPGSPVYAATALELTAPLNLTSGLTDRPLIVSSEGVPRRVTVNTGAGMGATAASVTVTNLFTANGVIHLIDRVLIPPQ